ncbi:angiopoietin-2-like [Ptychodera flava]|uniref:angiopoietin-2-like n=1 Tax=Ptychodera flava TaxID=63121 RepID=UPI00396A9C58
MLRLRTSLLLAAVAVLMAAKVAYSGEMKHCDYLKALPDEDQHAGSGVVRGWLTDKCRDEVLESVVDSMVSIVETSLDSKRQSKAKHHSHRHRRQAEEPGDEMDAEETHADMDIAMTEKPPAEKSEADLDLDGVSVRRQLNHLRESLKQLQGIQKTIDRRQSGQIRILEDLMEDSLQQSNDEWQKKMEDFEQAIEVWEAEKYVVHQVRELEVENAELRKRLGSLAQAVVRIQSVVISAKRNYDAIQQQMSTLVTAHQMLEDKLNVTVMQAPQMTHDVRVEQQDVDLGAANDQIERLKAQIQSSMDVTTMLQNNFSDLSSRLEPIQSLIRELDVTTGLMRDENYEQFNGINTALTALQHNQGSVIEDVAGLKEQVQEVVEDGDRIKSNVDTYNERFTAFQTSLSRQENQSVATVNGMHEVLEKMNNTISGLRYKGIMTFSGLEHRLETLENGTQEVEQVLNHLRRQEINLDERSAALGQSLTCLTQLQSIDDHQCYFPDCSELYKYGAAKQSGVYIIKPKNSNPIKVWCDMETDGGGWTVLQKRVNGTLDFYRNWTEYKNGFGDAEHEYWLGLRHIHALTYENNYNLRIDLFDWKDKRRFAVYNQFRLEDEVYNYGLQLGSYFGTAGDSMIYHNRAEFSTHDRDNDKSPAENAAEMWKGGWWYRRGYNVNLNGLYYKNGPYTSSDDWTDGIVWEKWHSWWYSLKGTDMKIRPRDYFH